MSILDSIRKSLPIRTDSDFIRNLDGESRIYNRESGIYDGESRIWPDEVPEEACFFDLQTGEPAFFDLMPLGVF